MTILFIPTYYNAPHFMEYQLKSFNMFVEDKFDVAVMDDASSDTKSLLSGKNAQQEIYEESQKLGLKYFKVPQTVHTSEREGGLVPNGLPTGHPTERHRACMHWIIKNHKNLGFNKYERIVFMESDMFIRKKINIKHYMENYDFIGPGRKNLYLKNAGNATQYWPEELKHLNDITIDFFPMYMLMVNMEKVNNLETLNIGGFAGTDTGGKTCVFIRNNQQYKYYYMDIGSNIEYQLDFFAKVGTKEEDAEFVHYKSGSNWDYQSIEYYREKFNRLLNKFIPEFNHHSKSIDRDLMSRDKEHTFRKE